MSADFESTHNYHQRAVFEAISAAAPDYPPVTGNDLLPDSPVAAPGLPVSF